MKFIKKIHLFLIGIYYLIFRLSAMAEDMKKAPEKFEGLYQPVVLLSKDAKRKNSALKEWRIRSCKLYPESALARFCSLFADGDFLAEYPDKTAKVLVKCFRKAGFTCDAPDENKQLTVNELQSYAYRAFDGHEIESGETLTVISPAWYSGEKIIEHGIAGEL